MKSELVLNANTLVDSLRIWIEPNAEFIIDASTKQTSASVVSMTIGMIIGLIVVVICFFSVKHFLKYGKDECGEFTMLAVIVTVFGSVVGFFTILAVVLSLPELIHIIKAPEYETLNNIIRLIHRAR